MKRDCWLWAIYYFYYFCCVFKLYKDLAFIIFFQKIDNEIYKINTLRVRKVMLWVSNVSIQF